MRKTVFIGAMKPMTAGHYQMIQQAISDTKCPPEEIPAKETYILISVQDRIKANQFPISGETAIEAFADFYSNVEGFLSDIPEGNTVNLIFVASNKFYADNPERIQIIQSAVNRIDQNLTTRGVPANVEFSPVRSGPPDYLLSLAETSPTDQFILYVGSDDVNKYKFLAKYASNIQTSSFERFAGGMSGTEVRQLFGADELSPEQSDRLKSAFPTGVDPVTLRDFYRSRVDEGGLLENILYGSGKVEEAVRTVFLKGLMK
jgi:hypothetical protein